jgi:hypothetical protein
MNPSTIKSLIVEHTALWLGRFLDSRAQHQIRLITNQLLCPQNHSKQFFGKRHHYDYDLCCG